MQQLPQPTMADILAATLSVEEPTRRAAEDALARLSLTAHHAEDLLRLAASPDQPSVATAAAIRLKNAARAARSTPSSTSLSHQRLVVVPSPPLSISPTLAPHPPSNNNTRTLTTSSSTPPPHSSLIINNPATTAPGINSQPSAPTTAPAAYPANHASAGHIPTSIGPTATPSTTHRSSLNPLQPDARRYVRRHILDVLASTTIPTVVTALAETLRWLVLVDFPANWPELLSQIQAFLASGNVRQVTAALLALHKVTKCYEFRTNEPNRLDLNDPNDANIAHPREPLDKIVAATFPTLLQLFQHLGDMKDSRDALECQKLIAKIFWCSMQFMMPPHLADQGVFNAWMDTFITVYQSPVHVPTNMANCSDLDLSVMLEFKIKKWIGNILLRLLKRYGHPKRAPVEEEHTRRVASIFHDQYAAVATTAMMRVLSWPSNGARLTGRVANIAIDFVQEAVETASLWAVISPHIHLLLSQVIFQYMCFNDEDEELWEADPIEYVRKQTDLAEDYSSPRVAAVNLLAQLGELRPKNTIFPFMTHLVNAVLEPYRVSRSGSPERAALARQKVGAMLALSACKLRLKSKPDLATSFLNVLIVHIEPDLRSEFGFLRASANKLLGDVASMDWHLFSEKLGEAALHGAVTALDDPEIPVQATAGSALHFLMEEDSARGLITPFAPQLLERLLILMDRMSDGFVTLLPTLDKLVDRYPDQLMPLAVPLMRRLVLAFQNSASEAKASGEEEESDDDLLFQAAQMLQLISSVLTTAGEWQKPNDEERKAMFAVLEKELQPVIEPMFDDGNQVFAEETLDVLHTLILQTGELRKGISPFLLSMVPRLVRSFDAWAGEYVSSDIVGPVEAYIAYDMDGLMSINAVPSLMSIAQRLWSDMFDDSEAIDGTKIADSLILGLARHHSRGSELSNQVVVNLARDAAKKCIATTDKSGSLRVRLFGTVMLSLYYDAELVVRELGGTGQVMQLISAVVSDLRSFTRIHDKKAVVLGISAMIRAPSLGLEQASPDLVRGIIKLQARIDEQRAGDERKSFRLSQVSALSSRGPGLQMSGLPVGAALSEAEGMNGGGCEDGDQSELDDDEDASNRALDGDEHDGFDGLQKLSQETGISVAELSIMNATGGSMATGGFLDFDDVDDGEDEGENPANALDDIDEVEYFVESIRYAKTAPWLSNLGQEERSAIDKLAQRLETA